MSDELDNLYLPQQNPVFIKVGEGKDGNKPLGTKAFARADYYPELHEKTMRGEQPYSGGEGNGGKWYNGQLITMEKAGFLPEEASIYTRTKEKERVLGFNPVACNYIFDREELKSSLHDAGINQVRIAGERINLLKKNQRLSMERQIDSANATIAIPGDLYAMQEMLYLFEQKMKGKMLNHPLIIENSVDAFDNGFWDELLRGLKIFDKNEAIGTPLHARRRYVDFKELAHHYGIYVSEDRDTTLKISAEVVPQQTPEENVKVKPFIPEDSMLFVATGTMKKYQEIKDICRANGINIKIRSIFELVDTYVSPDEDRRTYEGNAAKKVEAAFDSWHQMSEQERVDRLNHLGIKKEQAFIMAEDSGFHFLEPGLGGEDEFRKISQELDLKAPFPGVETGPTTIGSDGIQGFMQKIQQIFVRRQSQGKAVDDRVIKKSVIALAPLKQQEYGGVEMQMVHSEVHGRATFSPVPSHGAIEIDNYLIPENVAGLPKNRTEAQLEEKFFNHHSPRALAMKGMAFEVGIHTGKEITKDDDYSKEFCAGILVDNTSYVSKTQAEKMSKKAKQNGFGVITAPASTARPDDIQMNFLRNVDGVVVALDPAKAQEHFWENTYMFTSLIVGEQTHDKYKFRKPLYLVNPKDEHGKGAFDYLEELVDDCHNKGTVPENPNSLYKSVSTVEEAKAGLKQDRFHYRRMHLPAYATQEAANDTEGRKGSKDFNVAIFCSASNKNSRYKEDTRNLAESLIKADFGVVSGAGAIAMMGEVSDAATELRKEYGAEHFGSNVLHIMSGEGDVRDQMTEFLLARNIYERMEYMIDKSDAFAVMAGGTGTIQELALLAVLKKRALEGDEYAKDKMQGKEIVIINTHMDSSDKRFYDKLKEIVDVNDPEACRKLGIHFVNSVDAAMDKIKDLRTEKRGENWVDTKLKDMGRAA